MKGKASPFLAKYSRVSIPNHRIRCQWVEVVSPLLAPCALPHPPHAFQHPTQFLVVLSHLLVSMVSLPTMVDIPRNTCHMLFSISIKTKFLSTLYLELPRTPFGPEITLLTNSMFLVHVISIVKSTFVTRMHRLARAEMKTSFSVFAASTPVSKRRVSLLKTQSLARRRRKKLRPHSPSKSEASAKVVRSGSISR